MLSGFMLQWEWRLDGEKMADYEIVEHTADWSLRVRGRDLAELLRHAAEGMNGLMVGEGITAVLPTTTRTLTLDAYDAESLLVEWLGELAYWAEMEGLVFPEFTLTTVSPTHLQATLRGGPAPELFKHIKAVTYHNLEIIRTEDGLEVTIVFDV
jgi:SHS2 domain-containing protein